MSDQWVETLVQVRCVLAPHSFDSAHDVASTQDALTTAEAGK